jgi:hypothetical protein
MNPTNTSHGQQDFDQGQQIRQAVEDFEALIDGQLQSIAMLEAWLDDRDRDRNSNSMPDPGVRLKMAAKLKPGLARKKDRLLEARHTHVWSAAPDSPSWGRIKCKCRNTSANCAVVSIMGPSPDDYFAIVTCGEEDIGSMETFVRYVADVVCSWPLTIPCLLNTHDVSDMSENPVR